MSEIDPLDDMYGMYFMLEVLPLATTKQIKARCEAFGYSHNTSTKSHEMTIEARRRRLRWAGIDATFWERMIEACNCLERHDCREEYDLGRIGDPTSYITHRKVLDIGCQDLIEQDEQLRPPSLLTVSRCLQVRLGYSRRQVIPNEIYREERTKEWTTTKRAHEWWNKYPAANEWRVIYKQVGAVVLSFNVLLLLLVVMGLAWFIRKLLLRVVAMAKPKLDDLAVARIKRKKTSTPLRR